MMIHRSIEMAADENGHTSPSYRDGPTATFVYITPELARSFLVGNSESGNRNIRDNKVDRWRFAIRGGLWKQNGETIKFSKSGKLMDGQHRLTAIAKESVGVWCLVVCDLEEDVFDTIDCGAARKGSDALKTGGASGNVKVMAAALPRVAAHIRKKYDWGYSNSPQYILALWYDHPEILDSVWVNKKIGGIYPYPAAGVALHYVFSMIDRDAADRFFEALALGAGLGATDPVFLLRERMVRNSNGKAKLPEKEVVALTIKAWNASRSGAKIGVLRWRNEEDWPAISGLPG